MEFNLEYIQINLKIKYLNNILVACNKLSLPCNKINNLLNNLINKQNNEPELTLTINENIVTSDKLDYLYLKNWNKLNIIHKIIKIKEFINCLDINDENEKTILKDKLIEFIKDKNLSKKNKINYDSIKGNIISISCLSYENKKYIII